ncbi:restriction endonuclease subunit S [Candidatus Saccharibacteria bacterium]|nr:restriction endonuclease subunit S [Candidatus Saccharibacteria bacterium]
MEYNEKLNREIPADWTASALDDFISLERGISYTSKSISTGDGMPMINLASIDISRNYRVGTLKYFAGKYKSDKIVTAGDMLIACTDLTRNADIIGSPILVPREHKEYLYSMDLSRVVSKGLTDMYLYESLRTESYHNYIKHFASGTNVLHLDLNGLRWYKLPVPPSPLQESFANIVKPLRDKQAEIINENQKLIEQRDFLLPMLMNRQIGIAG